VANKLKLPHLHLLLLPLLHQLLLLLMPLPQLLLLPLPSRLLPLLLQSKKLIQLAKKADASRLFYLS
jgi:hypothetical protein